MAARVALSPLHLMPYQCVANGQVHQSQTVLSLQCKQNAACAELQLYLVDSLFPWPTAAPHDTCYKPLLSSRLFDFFPGDLKTMH